MFSEQYVRLLENKLRRLGFEPRDIPIAASDKYLSSSQITVTWWRHESLPSRFFSTDIDSVLVDGRSGTIPNVIAIIEIKFGMNQTLRWTQAGVFNYLKSMGIDCLYILNIDENNNNCRLIQFERAYLDEKGLVNVEGKEVINGSIIEYYKWEEDLRKRHREGGIVSGK